MSWGMIGAATITTVGGKLASKGSGGGGSDIKMPDFYEDPYYKKTQDALFPLGEDITKGNIPPYYAPIGEIGGETFEKMLGLGTRDLSKAVTELAARRGTRGGAVDSTLSRGIGDLGTKMRFQDLLRGVEGRKFLLGAGTSILSDVRTGALNFSKLKNMFELDKAGVEIKAQRLASEESQKKGGMWSDILESGIGAISNIFTPGMTTGGSAGGSTDDWSMTA